MELLAGLVRSEATEQRLIAERAQSRHVISTGRAVAKVKVPEKTRGLTWSYWPDLNRRPIVTPKKCAVKAHQGWSAFFGDPVCLIFGLTDSKRANKPKQKSTRKGCLFCLELLAGLEPATC